MTASFLLISLQTQSFVLAGPYTVCAPLHHFLPLYPSFPFLSGFLPFFLSNYFFTHSIPPFLFVTILEPFFLCLCPFVVFTLHSFFQFFFIWTSFTFPVVLCFFFNFSFSLLLLSLSSFLSFPLSFLFLFVLLPLVLQCISHSTSFCEQLKFFCLTCTSFFAIAEDTQMEKVFGITALR